jgi:hypothetical protein
LKVLTVVVYVSFLQTLVDFERRPRNSFWRHVVHHSLHWQSRYLSRSVRREYFESIFESILDSGIKIP